MFKMQEYEVYNNNLREMSKSFKQNTINKMKTCKKLIKVTLNNYKILSKLWEKSKEKDMNKQNNNNKPLENK